MNSAKFEKCAQPTESALTSRQEIYDEYMRVAPCVFEEMARQLEQGCANGGDVQKVGETLVNVLGAGMLDLYAAIDYVHAHGGVDAFDRLPNPSDAQLEEMKRRLVWNHFFSTRERDEQHNGTFLLLSDYPKLRELFGPFWEENRVGDLLPKSRRIYDNNDRYLTYLLPDEYGRPEEYRWRVGQYQLLTNSPPLTSDPHRNYRQEVANGVLYLYHPHPRRLFDEDPLGRYEPLMRELGKLWCTFLRAPDKKRAYELYYLFANMVPYSRGSAGAAKVLLNVALHIGGFPSVRERAEYARQADWAAFVAPNFEDFWEHYVNRVFVENPKKRAMEFGKKGKRGTKLKK